MKARSKLASVGVATVWFIVHSGIVYISVIICTPWLAARVHDWILPHFDLSGSTSQFEFLFSHLLFFSAFPAVIAGCVNYKREIGVARLVWIVPALGLIRRLLAFRVSVLQPRIHSAFGYYFGGQFVIPEYHGYRDLFSVAQTHQDMLRGIDQFRFTAPFYAGVAYSVAAFAFSSFAKALRMEGIVEQDEAFFI